MLFPKDVIFLYETGPKHVLCSEYLVNTVDTDGLVQ